MAILQTEGLVKVNRGYYQTAKLVEVHKVTDRFAAFACRTVLKNEPSVPQKRDIEIVGGGYSFFEGGKDGTNGKTLDKNSSEPVEQHIIEGAEPVKAQPMQPAPSRVCGDCGRLHTKDCQHPVLAMGGEPELVKADSSWACECQGWTNRTKPVVP
jgi:hypothetical protein